MPSAALKTEELVIQSARKLFVAKGYEGTSVSDIATEAGTTKSMVNYYFRSKEKLFAKVFRSEFKQLFTSIGMVLSSDLPLKEKIQQIVELDINKLIKMPELPVFVLSELHRNTEIILKDLEEIPIKLLLHKLEKEMKALYNSDKLPKLYLFKNTNEECKYIFKTIKKQMKKHNLKYFYVFSALK